MSCRGDRLAVSRLPLTIPLSGLRGEGDGRRIKGIAATVRSHSEQNYFDHTSDRDNGKHHGHYAKDGIRAAQLPGTGQTQHLATRIDMPP